MRRIAYITILLGVFISTVLAGCGGGGESGSQATDAETKSENPPLVLKSLTSETITNQPEYPLIGVTEPGAVLSVNGIEATVGSDGSFTTVVPLNEGTNTITIDARLNERTATIQQVITLDTDPPPLTVTSPTDTFTLTNRPSLTIVGATEQDAEVFINNEPIPATSGAFSHAFSLFPGDNYFQIVARDSAGNRRQVDRQVNQDVIAPYLAVTFPEGDSYYYGTWITMTGLTEPGCRVSIHPVEFPVDPDGHFSAYIRLNVGYNAPRVYSKDPAGNIASVCRKITRTTIPPGVVAVDKDANGFVHDGKSWNTAFLHPQDAMDAASPGDRIWVAEGTYAAPGTDTSVPVLAMKDDIEVYGGFAGTKAPMYERNPILNPTILDGENRTEHVVTGANNSRLDGFVVTRGNSGNGSGAGMLNEGVMGLKVMNSFFTSNVADGDGGGMHNDLSEVEIGYSVFRNNKGYRGGGIENFSNCTLVIYNTTLVGNAAFGGGAIHNGGGAADGYTGGNIANVYNCLIADNTAGNGGGITYVNSAGNIVNTTIANNSGSNGGGNYNHAGIPVFVNSIIYGNAPNQIYNEASGGASVSYSDVEGGYAGIGNIDALPLFLNPANLDFNLSTDSPCIDAGDDSFVTGSFDLDDDKRILDGPDINATAEVDMGAQEFGGFSLLRRFETPVNLGANINSQYNESGLSVTGDGNTIYFCSDRPGGLGGSDIYFSVRVDGVWQPAQNLGTPVNSLNAEYDPAVTPDGKKIFFASNRGTFPGSSKIYSSEKVDGMWQMPVELPGSVNLSVHRLDGYLYNRSGIFAHNDNPAFVSDDGRWLYWSTMGWDFGFVDIFRVDIQDGGYSVVEHLPMPVNTEGQPFNGGEYYVGQEFANYLTREMKYLLFSSDSNLNGVSLNYGAARIGGVYQKRVLLPFPFNGFAEPVGNHPFILADNETVAYFAALNGPGGFGEGDLYVANAAAH